MKTNYGYDPKTFNLTVKGYSGQNEVIVKCPNPQHTDNNPSACFNTDSGLLFCFSCGYSANITQLSSLAGFLYIPSKTPKPDYKKDSENLWKDFEKLGVAYNDNYLINRGVTEQNIKDFDIRKMNKGIVFLFRDSENHLTGCQIRQYYSKPKYLTFGKRSLWDLRKLNTYDRNEPVYLTEGVFGAIRGYNAGKQTLAVIGAMIKQETVKELAYYPRVIGLFDDDLAGYIAGARLLKYVPQAKIIIPGCEADELSIDEWSKIDDRQKTKSIVELAKRSGNKKEFYKYVV